MSLLLSEKKARLTVFGRGWNDKAVDSGEAGTEDGYVIKDISDAGDYDWGVDLDWDAVADYIGIDITDGYYLDDDGTVYTDDDGDGVYIDENGYEYDGDGDYYSYGYYEDYDGIQYTDYDGDGVYTDDYGNEYPGDGTYFPSEVLTDKIDQGLSQLSKDEQAVYECMTDHGDSTEIPARIRVTNPPNKLEYNDGDEINFSEIVVCAYSSLTARTPFIRQEWDGPRHNQVPYEELSFPVTTASKGDVHGDTVFQDYQSSGEVVITSKTSCRALYEAVLRASGRTLAGNTEHIQWLESQIEFEDNYYASRMFQVLVYDTPSSSGEVLKIYRLNDYNIGETIKLGGKNRSRIYFEYILYGTITGSVINVTARKRQDDGTITFMMKNYIGIYSNPETGVAYGVNINGIESPATVSVPVQWQTDYREEPYETEFEIEVT